ncbi:MAG TPA: hypothetical protein VIA18_30850, partial [Polyangia bacterium]|nr:hypothetical protein [Polyangia bacterium]
LTLDGRFLDLEVPVLFGAPFVGVLARAAAPVTIEVSAESHLVGFDVFHYVRQARAFVRFLVARLRQLRREIFHTSGPELRRFLTQLTSALTAELNPDHVLFSAERLIETVVGHIDDALSLTPAERRRVRQLARAQYARHLDRTLDARAQLELVPLDFRPARSEPHAGTAALAPRFVAERVPSYDAGALVRDEIERVERSADLDALLAAIVTAEQRISAHFAPPIQRAVAP